MRLTGNFLSKNNWVFGYIDIRGSLIYDMDISGSEATEASYILPGFIDLHVHGGGGADIMQGGDAPYILAQTHARFGTTSLLATTMTAKTGDIMRALEAVSQAMKNPAEGAEIIGVHLEGPFINPNKLGAQPDYAVRADPALIDKFCAAAPVKIVTLAPEFSENMAIIPWLKHNNIRPQIGHSTADYGQCLCAMKRGVDSFTHLYNAMSPLQGREAGIVGSALAHSEYCEIIPDLVHTDEGALLAAMRAVPRLYGITDGTAACGMPDGAYKLGENDVFRKGNSVRLKNGTLAGSVLTLDRAFRNFMKLGDSPAQASQRLSAYPADYLGLADRGRLLPGLRADIIIMDKHFHVRKTFAAGKSVYNSMNASTITEDCND